MLCQTFHFFRSVLLRPYSDREHYFMIIAIWVFITNSSLRFTEIGLLLTIDNGCVIKITYASIKNASLSYLQLHINNTRSKDPLKWNFKISKFHNLLSRTHFAVTILISYATFHEKKLIWNLFILQWALF